MDKRFDRESMEKRISGIVQSMSRRVGACSSDSRWNSDLALLEAVIAGPSSDLEKFTAPSGLNRNEVRSALRRWRIDSVHSQRRLAARVREGAELLESFLTTDKIAPFVYDRMKAMAFHRSEPFYVAALVLREMCRITCEPSLNGVKELVPSLGFKFALGFLRDIVDAVGEERGLRPQRVAKANEDPRIAELEVRVSDLTSSLEITQQQLESLEEELKSVREEAAQDASVDFFRELNAPTWGGLLDQLYASEGRIAKLRSEGTIPQELESTATTVRMVVRFLKKSGLKEIVPVGTKLTLSLNDVDGYIYEGSQFGDGEAKDVLVQSPGWSYRGEVVSRPSVKEA